MKLLYIWLNYPARGVWMGDVSVLLKGVVISGLQT